MPKNYVIHTRVTDETYHKLSNICNEIGCNKTDYVISLLVDSFEEDDPAIIEPEPIKKKKPEPKLTLVNKPKAVVRSNLNLLLTSNLNLNHILRGIMNRVDYLKKFHDQCPYCERPFSKKKNTVNSKIIRQMVDNYFESSTI